MTKLFLQARMAVIPIGTGLDNRELINEGRSRLDARKADTRHAVHLERQQQTVPVDRAVDVEIVDDAEPRGLALFQTNKRTRHSAVDPDGPAYFTVDPHCLPCDSKLDVVARNRR